MDLVLSSGFLAFSRHVGFLTAVEDWGGEIEGLCGTSSGALVGALWAAGVPARDIGALLSEHPPLSHVRLSRRPWRGLLSLDGLLSRLDAYLPATFEELPIPVAVGVMRPDRSAALLHSGALAEAVAASCAVPWLFEPVLRDGALLRDGGVVDRTGLVAWRGHRPHARVLLHLVERSHGATEPSPPADVQVVETPRTGAKLWDLGDFDGQVEEAYRLTQSALTDALAGAAR